MGKGGSVKNIIQIVIAALGFAALVAIGAVIGGTVVWILWPSAVPVLFPGLVESGAIVARAPWWACVCFAWICSWLFKGSTSKTEKKGGA